MFRNAQVRVPRGWCRGRCREGELLPRSRQLMNFIGAKFWLLEIAFGGCFGGWKFADFVVEGSGDLGAVGALPQVHPDHPDQIYR